jgi:hypothetical protein
MTYLVEQSSSYRILTDLIPSAKVINETGLNKETGWLSIHNRGTKCHELSSRWLLEVVNAKCKVDILTQSGRTLYACHPNDARVVINYSAAHTPPENGVVAWRVSPMYLAQIETSAIKG